MKSGLNKHERELVTEFIKKAKEHGYEQDACIIGAAIALCKQPPKV